MLKTLLNNFVNVALDKATGLTLGVIANKPTVRITLPDNEARMHMLITGATGHGASKLQESILNQRTRNGQGWVYVDPCQDAELRDRLYSQAVASSREDEFFVIDLASPENSYSIDFLEGTPADVAAELAEVLDEDNSSRGVGFYKHTGRAAIELILEAFQATGRKCTLDDLFAALMDSQATEALIRMLPAESKIAQQLTDFNRHHMAIERERYFKLRPVAERLAQLNSLSRKDVLNATNAQVSLMDILLTNQLCIITLPPGDELSVACRVLLKKLTHAILARAALPKRLRNQVTTVCLPACHAYLRDWENNALYARARAYGVSLLATWVDNGMGGVPEIIEGNTWTKVKFESTPAAEDIFEVTIRDNSHLCKHAPVSPVERVSWRKRDLPASVDYKYPLNLQGVVLHE